MSLTMDDVAVRLMRSHGGWTPKREQKMELESFSGGGATIKPDEILGHLLLVWAISYIPHAPTKFTVAGKPSDVIVVDVVDLSTGAVGVQSWWRQGRLIRDLKPKIGRPNPILVMIRREIASQGAQPPYDLVPMDSDPQAVAVAKSWFAANPDFKPSQPVPYNPQVVVEGSQPNPGGAQLNPNWGAPLPSEPGGPAWLPAQETWPSAAPAAAPTYLPPAPARPLTQAERMAQAEDAPF